MVLAWKATGLKVVVAWRTEILGIERSMAAAFVLIWGFGYLRMDVNWKWTYGYLQRCS